LGNLDSFGDSNTRIRCRATFIPIRGQPGSHDEMIGSGWNWRFAHGAPCCSERTV
jgi:hypothetical protein